MDVDTFEACLEFSRKHGYPVVLKQEASVGGAGAFILDSEAALSDFSSGDQFCRSGRSWVIQGFVPGDLGMHAVLADRGRVLAQVGAVQITRRSSRLTAPSSVVRLVQHDAMAASCAAFVAATEASGFHGWDFQLNATGSAVMIEHNPRPISISHLGHLLGDDLCRALAILCGVSAGKPDPGVDRECRVALFPDEWQRDPLSPMLREAFHDAPWDDQPLFTALLNDNVRFI
jgi:predicted ATP-grasp superfamily ATP-dependent carboligase